jgi:hypothetical protein
MLEVEQYARRKGQEGRKRRQGVYIAIFNSMRYTSSISVICHLSLVICPANE